MTPRRSLAQRLLDTWLAWAKGQLLLSLIMGAAIWAVGDIMGLSYAGWLGFLAGAMESIPTFGPIIAVVPAAIVALWKGSAVIDVPNWGFMLIVIGVYIVLQQLQALLIQPKFLGDRLDLPPLLVLVAVLAGAFLAGPVGAILAVPVLASLRQIIAHYSNRPSAQKPPESASDSPPDDPFAAS